jgi:hypothetical protein
MTRIAVRQRAQEDAVDDAEECGVGADAEGEGEDRDGVNRDCDRLRL